LSVTANSFEADFVDFVKSIYSGEENVPLHAPRFSDADEQSVLEAVRSSYVSSVGAMVEEFEQEISTYTGAKYVVATNTGTAALHAALKVIDVEIGDEVITQSLTFVATCNAISYCGAYPVFVDVDEDSLSLSPIWLEEFLTKNSEIRNDNQCWNTNTGRRIRACIPVHNLGHPARTDQISEICARFKVLMIEDAAESLGSFENGKHTGLNGILVTLSFNGNKIITTGGGGAIITNDESLAKSARHLTTTAKKAHPWLFLHDVVGFNYRMPNLNAALGCAQIASLDKFLISKRELAQQYANWFAQYPVSFFPERPATKANYWLNAILLKDKASRDKLLSYTNNNGVMTRPMWTPMHTLPMYSGEVCAPLDNTEDIEARLVCIPSGVPIL